VHAVCLVRRRGRSLSRLSIQFYCSRDQIRSCIAKARGDRRAPLEPDSVLLHLSLSFLASDTHTSYDRGHAAQSALHHRREHICLRLRLVVTIDAHEDAPQGRAA
jgi:hypothetical protein